MMFMPNTDRQINVSSGSNFIGSHQIAFDTNLRSFVGSGGGLVGLGNMMENYNNFWSHTVPTNMPWASAQPNTANVNYVDNNQPFVMRFTAGPSLYNDVNSPDPCTSQTATEWELLNKLSSGTGTCTSNLHLKRRNSSDDEDDDDSIRQPPTKQYISEDKVTARFNQMTISNNNNNDDDSEKVDDDELLDTEENRLSLILSQEIKKALESRDDRVDKLFKEEMSKASKAIVLWQPPLGLLQPQLAVFKGNNEEKIDLEEQASDSSSEKDVDSLDVDIDVPDVCVMDANEMMDL